MAQKARAAAQDESSVVQYMNRQQGGRGTPWDVVHVFVLLGTEADCGTATQFGEKWTGDFSTFRSYACRFEDGGSRVGCGYEVATKDFDI